MSGETGPVRVAVIRYPDRPNLVLAYTDPVTGRRRTKSAGTRRMADAQRMAAKWEAQLEAGVVLPSERTGWDRLVDEYAETVLSVRRKATRQSYMGTITAYEQALNPRSAGNLTTAAVARFTAALRARSISEATVAGHLRNLKALFRWAQRQGYLRTLPQFEMPRGSSRMKSRPITLEEFERMVAAVEQTPDVPAARVEDWRLLLRGLWATGLRLGEALALRWEQTPGGAWLVLDGQRSVIAFDGAAQKSGRSELCPLAPEAVALLAPLRRKSGWVFSAGRDKYRVSRTISAIGRQAGVVTDPERKRTATAHDLRRAFGTRWSRLVMPATLKALMRHASVETTMTYYVGQQAEAVSMELWAIAAAAESNISVTPPPIEAPRKGGKVRKTL
jgi:integrase